MSIMQINIAARTDKAGRSANQDSLLVCADLDNLLNPNPGAVNKDTWIPLGSRGALLAVADGMGGASSGEIASATVVQSLRKSFSTIPTQILDDDAGMLQFMRQALVNADQEIKAYANAHPQSQGLGSTTVMVWLYSGKALCAWVGDSRIYRFGSDGLQRLSHDHSYVQQLVDAGAITPGQAFSHPNGNIITRAMGDTGKPVEPDVKAVALNSGDLILLCSDGLSGLLPDDVIQSVVASHIGTGKSSELLQGLWSRGEAAGWSDNATIIVAMTAGQPAQPLCDVPDMQTQRVSVRSVQSVPSQTVLPVEQSVIENIPAVVSTSLPQNAQRIAPSVSKPVRKQNSFLLPMWVWCVFGFLVIVVAVLALISSGSQKEEDLIHKHHNTDQTIPVSDKDDDADQADETPHIRIPAKEESNKKEKNAEQLGKEIIKQKPTSADDKKVEEVSEKLTEDEAQEKTEVSSEKSKAPDNWERRKDKEPE